MPRQFMHGDQNFGIDYVPITEEMRRNIRTLISLIGASEVGSLLGAKNCKTRVVSEVLNGKQRRIRTHFYNKIEAKLAEINLEGVR